MAKKKWRSFEEAREYTRGLGLKGKNEWQEYSKSGKRPDDIPSTPHTTYKSQWQNWKDWLGTEWRPFEEAREFVRDLRLINRAAWDEYCRSGEKPADIPADPYKKYKAEFKGMGDWLGTGTIAKQNLQYRPFSEARDFARELGLKSALEWRKYCKSGKKPTDIPADPYSKYKAEFKGWGDWLGTGNMHSPEYRSFFEAREYARSLGLKGVDEWRDYVKSGKKPADIPASPYGVYRSQWTNWKDWLGTTNVRRRVREWRRFEEAREFVRGLGLKSVDAWKEYCKSGANPEDIPSSPGQVYDEFKGYSDWIGHINVRSTHREFRSFEKAREFVRELSLKDKNEWLKYIRSGEKPTDIPSRPDAAYRAEFKGWGTASTGHSLKHVSSPVIWG